MWARVGMARRLANSASEPFGEGGVRFATARKACGRSIGSVVATVNPSPSTQSMVQVVGGLQPVMGVTALKYAAQVLAVTGADLKYRLVVRLYATNRSEPGAWSATTDLEGWQTASSSGSTEANSGELTGFPTGWSDAMWFEVGLMLQLQSASVQATVKARVVAKL
jgi:hypothetical protein